MPERLLDHSRTQLRSVSRHANIVTKLQWSTRDSAAHADLSRPPEFIEWSQNEYWTTDGLSSKASPDRHTIPHVRRRQMCRCQRSDHSLCNAFHVGLSRPPEFLTDLDSMSAQNYPSPSSSSLIAPGRNIVLFRAAVKLLRGQPWDRGFHPFDILFCH